MNNEYRVVKFGEKYLTKEDFQEFGIGGGSVVIELTDDLFRARRFRRDDFYTFDKMIGLGGRIVEVSLFEVDKTYSIRDEIKEDKKTLEQDEADDF